MGRFSDILLAVDFDRTLTDRQSRIPQKNIDAIRYFTAQGGLFTVATGRSVPMFRAQQAKIPYNAPLILYNGAASYDYRTEKLGDAVPLPEGEKVLQWLLRELPELWLEIQGEDYHYLLGENPMRDAFYRRNNAASIHFTADTPPPGFVKIALFGDFYDDTVASFFRISEREAALFDAACEKIRSTWPALTVERAAPRIIDLMERTVNKGSAARALASRLGRRTLACVGDSFNDLPLLREGDFAFVPQDADLGAQAAEFTLVCPCDDGSVAGAIDRLSEIFS